MDNESMTPQSSRLRRKQLVNQLVRYTAITALWVEKGMHRPSEWNSIERQMSKAVRNMIHSMSGGEFTMTKNQVAYFKKNLNS